jgi:hypothetical protein
MVTACMFAVVLSFTVSLIHFLPCVAMIDS